jgi:hypothetical protein
MIWTRQKTKTGSIILLVSLSIAFFIPDLKQFVLANHGKEIIIEFNNGQYLTLPEKNIQQVKLTATYTVEDSEWVGKQVSGTMKIYTSNGTLIKTTSIPNGFTAEESGFQQFVTSLPDSSIQSVTAVVIFTELNQTSALSNSVTENLVLNKTS